MKESRDSIQKIKRYPTNGAAEDTRSATKTVIIIGNMIFSFFVTTRNSRISIICSSFVVRKTVL